MEQEKPVLIETAAKELDIKSETIVGWIEDGKVKMVHPNYVLMSDIRRAYVGVRNRKGHTFLPPRGDGNGFKLLGKE